MMAEGAKVLNVEEEVPGQLALDVQAVLVGISVDTILGDILERCCWVLRYWQRAISWR
jgi:hypothetical protein